MIRHHSSDLSRDCLLPEPNLKTTLSFNKDFILSSSSTLYHLVVYLFQDLNAVVGRRQLLLLRLLLLLLL